jgi:hypothetical protein
MNQDAHDGGDAIQLYPPYRHAVQQFLAAGFTDGQIVPHEWFYQQFGLVVPSPEMPVEQADKIRFQFLSQMTGFKEILLHDHLRAIRNHQGKGYTVVPASEQTGWAMQEKQKDLRRTAEELVDLVNSVRIEELSPAQRSENADARVKAAMLRQMVSKRGSRRLGTVEHPELASE